MCVATNISIAFAVSGYAGGDVSEAFACGFQVGEIKERRPLALTGPNFAAKPTTGIPLDGTRVVWNAPEVTGRVVAPVCPTT